MRPKKKNNLFSGKDSRQDPMQMEVNMTPCSEKRKRYAIIDDALCIQRGGYLFQTLHMRMYSVH